MQAGDLEDRDDDDAIALFNAVYRRWHHGELDVAMPGGETGAQVLDRYLPVVANLRDRLLDGDDPNGDIIVVSHGAAIRLVAATLAGVDNGFVLENHLANIEAIALSPLAGDRWHCLQWGSAVPPSQPESNARPECDAPGVVDPMG